MCIIYVIYSVYNYVYNMSVRFEINLLLNYINKSINAYMMGSEMYYRSKKCSIMIYIK